MSVVGGFVFGGWDEAEVAVEASVVVPVERFQRGELELVETFPGATVSDQLGLVQADDRFGERVVVAVAPGADRAGDVVFGEPVGVANRQILAAAVGVMDEPVEVESLTVSRPDGLFERRER